MSDAEPTAREAAAPVRILIVDDHPVVRQGLRAMLEPAPEIEVVGEAADAHTALHLVGELRPTIVLTDIRMPVINGIELANRLHLLFPDVAVVMLSNYEDQELLRDAFQARARGYLLKTATLAEIVDSLVRVARGERVLSSDLLGDVLAEFGALAREHAQHATGLSGDDLRLLHHIAAGLSNQEIARVEFVSEATVKRRIRDLYAKLGVTDRARAIAHALSQGIIGQ